MLNGILRTRLPVLIADVNNCRCHIRGIAPPLTPFKNSDRIQNSALWYIHQVGTRNNDFGIYAHLLHLGYT